jgi:transposase
MFIRQVKKQRNNNTKVFYQYTLVQAVRIDGKAKQRSILYLGSDHLLQDKNNRAIVLNMLKSKIFKQPDLFPIEAADELKELADKYYEKYCIKYDHDEQSAASIPTQPTKAKYENIDIDEMQVTDTKEFGAENLCKQVLDKLQLKEIFHSLGLTKSQSTKALISIAARAIYAQTEYKTSQILEMNSELTQCYNYEKKITHKQLYAISDILYKHKENIDELLYNRVVDVFGLEDKIVIFDISNTYFESRKSQSEIAKYGRNKEKRYDCPMVVFTGVINADGFIRHSRIYEGNKPDPATLEDMINDLKVHSSTKAKQTIVIDAGIATDDNIELIDEKNYNYICVSRKKIRDYPTEVSSSSKIQLTKRGKSSIKLSIFTPSGYTDTWMYVESEEKRKKETSMSQKLRQRFEEDLDNIKNAFSKKGGTKKINKVWERIGRAKERNNRVSGRYEIEVEQENGIATELKWTIKPDKVKDDKSKGVYFIRTNYTDTSEEELWEIYNTIREVESTFRSLKSDLNIRPIHHQNDSRVEAHLYLTMLAYQLVNTIRYMLKKNNINYDWKNIVRIMSTQKIQTVKLPAATKVINIRKSSIPIKEAKEIYDATGCKSTQSIVKKYVVYH